MALLFMDSFDHYATADLGVKWNTTSGSPSIQSTAGRRGGGALRQGTASVTLPVSGNVVVAGLAIKPPAFGASQSGGIQILAGATIQLTLTCSAAGQLVVYRGDTLGTLLGTQTGTLSASVYQYVELKATIHPSAGTVDVHVNGVSVLSLTGVNTAASGSAGWTIFRISPLLASGTTDYDDLYVLDGSGSGALTDFLGDVRVDARLPTAEGAASDWTPLSGSDNALMVDDAAPDGDTTYNETAVVGNTDTHVTEDAPVTDSVIYGVQVLVNFKKTDVGVCSVAPVVRHSGTNNVGTGVAAGTSYAYLRQAYAVNPGTGVAWTVTDFNAAQFGYQRSA